MTSLYSSYPSRHEGLAALSLLPKDDQREFRRIAKLTKISVAVHAADCLQKVRMGEAQDVFEAARFYSQIGWSSAMASVPGTKHKKERAERTSANVVEPQKVLKAAETCSMSKKRKRKRNAPQPGAETVGLSASRKIKKMKRPKRSQHQPRMFPQTRDTSESGG